jgi:sugar/nucleoside kinase (ribokinase family)
LGARYQDRIYPSKKVDVVDVCGAGDTFFASLVFAYMNFNGDIEKAITFANKAGSISVQHQGNYCPTLEEINNA